MKKRKMINEEEDLPVLIYTPESQLRHSRQLIRSMFADLRASRELASRLFIRNISAQYRQSILGYVWAFLPPLFTTMIWVFLNSQSILNVGETDIPYPAYVLVGTLLWQGFIDALNSPLKLVASSRSMLAKINFPREALLLAGLGEVIFNFVIRLVLLIGVFLWFQLPVPATIFLAPLGVVALLLLGVAIGVLLTPLGLLYGDIQKALMIITQLWFFLTPVIYTPTNSWPASLLTEINPVSPILITTRAWIVGGEIGDYSSFMLVIAATVVFIIFGWLFYRLAMPHIIERISA